MAAEIHRLRPDVQFVVAGEGDMLPLLIERACGLGLADTLVFAGKVNTTEAKMLYAQADCFVMPSLSGTLRARRAGSSRPWYTHYSVEAVGRGGGH